MNEWVLHKFLEYNNLINLHYDFITVSINGDNLGLYAIEENFDKNLIENNITVNGEHYVGTSINYLVEHGKKIVIFDIEQWISFGDPFELKILEYWQDVFQRERVSHE